MDKTPERSRKGVQPSRNTTEGKYDFMTRKSGTRERISIEHVDAQTLADAISTVIDNGDLISFTRTSDGGAICLTVIAGNKRHKTYATTLDELSDVLNALTC